jgi:hypothetical protein
MALEQCKLVHHLSLKKNGWSIVLNNSSYTEIQANGRIRYWAFETELGKYLRVVTEPDGETIHMVIGAKSQLTTTVSTPPPPARIFKHTLLAASVLIVSDLAHSQAGETEAIGWLLQSLTSLGLKLLKAATSLQSALAAGPRMIRRGG